ncbi:hypothetical protein KR009_010131 [Drosophila setifemur]|nr:hypothetical protein KR009_010131 [Drosophila setifemur]
MLPYPNDCRKYFACFRGQAIEKQCPANLFWSQMTYRCDYREYASCKNDDFPDQSPVQFAPFPGDCRRYYEISVHICPENSHWSPTYQRCVDAQIAGCEVAPVTIPPWEPYPSYPSNPIPPTIVPTAATPPSMIETPIENAPLPIDPNMLCKSSGSKDFIPYPVDCHKFIHCGPISTILTCSGNLYWSPITLKCGISSSDCQNYH